MLNLFYTHLFYHIFTYRYTNILKLSIVILTCNVSYMLYFYPRKNIPAYLLSIKQVRWIWRHSQLFTAILRTARLPRLTFPVRQCIRTAAIRSRGWTTRSPSSMMCTICPTTPPFWLSIARLPTRSFSPLTTKLLPRYFICLAIGWNYVLDLIFLWSLYEPL